MGQLKFIQLSLANLLFFKRFGPPGELSDALDAKIEELLLQRKQLIANFDDHFEKLRQN